eukprot:10165492-Ditylum_brightwellii.AAC.1
MPSPPPGTKQQWIDIYMKEEEENSQQLLALAAEYSTLSLNYSPEKDNPHFCILLPEHDPSLLTSISEVQQGDWDETHPKTRIGAVMKGKCEE